MGIEPRRWATASSGRAVSRRNESDGSTKISSGDYDIFLLDAFTYVMHYSWLDANEVIVWYKSTSPMLHLIIKRCSAPTELIAYADLVTEMRCRRTVGYCTDNSRVMLPLKLGGHPMPRGRHLCDDGMSVEYRV